MIARCYQCAAVSVNVAEVQHRKRSANGGRFVTMKRPICGPCVIGLTKAYKLDDVDGPDMGISHFVEGWHADGLRIAWDVLGGHG